jgi:16S rRNA C1402 N4-methylase RsmH
MPTYTLYGITREARMPPNASEYVGYAFPQQVEVPRQFGGPATHKVTTLFEEAFRELAQCARRPACDRHFSGLGGELGLSALLSDWKMYFFCFAPQGAQNTWPADDKNITYAQVVGTYKATSLVEIGIHLCALRSAEFLAATILHELAHVAGAPGASADDLARHAKRELTAAEFRRLHAAERAVYACGLRSQYKQKVIGALDTIIGGPRRIT